jgi:hypothetical protein
VGRVRRRRGGRLCRRRWEIEDGRWGEPPEAGTAERGRRGNVER